MKNVFFYIIAAFLLMITGCRDDKEVVKIGISLQSDMLTLAKGETKSLINQMDTKALVALFKSLHENATSPKTICINRNPGEDDLTASDLSIATSKGWSFYDLYN